MRMIRLRDPRPRTSSAHRSARAADRRVGADGPGELAERLGAEVVAAVILRRDLVDDSDQTSHLSAGRAVRPSTSDPATVDRAVPVENRGFRTGAGLPVEFAGSGHGCSLLARSGASPRPRAVHTGALPHPARPDRPASPRPRSPARSSLSSPRSSPRSTLSTTTSPRCCASTDAHIFLSLPRDQALRATRLLARIGDCRARSRYPSRWRRWSGDPLDAAVREDEDHLVPLVGRQTPARRGLRLRRRLPPRQPLGRAPLRQHATPPPPRRPAPRPRLATRRLALLAEPPALGGSPGSRAPSPRRREERPTTTRAPDNHVLDNHDRPLQWTRQGF